MEEWFSRFFQNLQLQLGLRDPKLTAPEKNISGIFLETDTGENIDILLVGKDGCAEELRGRTPAEELVRFTSLDFAEYHAVIQRLWTEHPLFLERMDVPYSDYEDFEKQIGDLPDWIMKIDTIAAFLCLRTSSGRNGNAGQWFADFSVRERCRSSSGTGRAVQGTAAYSKSSGDRFCRL